MSALARGPRIIAPSRQYSSRMYRPSACAAVTSMRVSHFIQCCPVQPGTTTRSGKPWGGDERLAVHRPGQQHTARAHIGDRQAADKGGLARPARGRAHERSHGRRLRRDPRGRAARRAACPSIAPAPAPHVPMPARAWADRRTDVRYRHTPGSAGASRPAAPPPRRGPASAARLTRPSTRKRQDARSTSGTGPCER